MFIENKIKSLSDIHFKKENQLNIVDFESPLQQVLQQNHLLLRLLNQQNKWQLWLSTRSMLKRSWFKQSELNENKIIHLSNATQTNIIDIIEKALYSQTCSYVVACIDNSLNDADKYRLQVAVKASGTHLFLVDDSYMNYNDFMTMSLAVNNIH